MADRIIRDVFDRDGEGGGEWIPSDICSLCGIPKKRTKIGLAGLRGGAVYDLRGRGGGMGRGGLAVLPDRQQASIVFDGGGYGGPVSGAEKAVKPVMSVKRLVYQPTNGFLSGAVSGGVYMG